MPQITVDTSTSITYTLSIIQLNSEMHEGIRAVTHVHWKLTAVDEDGHSVSTNGTKPYNIKEIHVVDKATKETRLEVPADFNVNDYIPYDELTEEQVINWIDDDKLIPHAKEMLAERLAKIHNAPADPVPWQTQG